MPRGKKKPDLEERVLGDDAGKLNSRLRLILNGSPEVNRGRAGLAAAIRVVGETRKAKQQRAQLLQSLTAESAPTKLPKLKHLASNVEASVFVTRALHNGQEDDPAASRLERKKRTGLIRDPRRRGNLEAGRVLLSDLPKLAKDPAVVSIELAERLRAPQVALGEDGVEAPSPGLRFLGGDGGENVLIGVIDVNGFDFAHEDFLDSAGKTRFVRIWDQGGDRRSPPKDAGFSYGAEITESHLDAAMKQQKRKGGLPATEYEPQSEMAEDSHGTHVASIAAGNLGVCRKAKIAAVLVDLGNDLSDRRSSLYDSTRLADAVDYLLGVAEELKLPISINVSLGTNGHAHDGSSAISRWIDYALTVPGRCVCVAAGNAGQQGPLAAADLGYLNGRIHTSGRIAATGLSADIEWMVLGSGVFDISENELEIWYSSADRFGISVQPPGMPWTPVVLPGSKIENRSLPDGSLFSVYNELYHPANGCNYLGLYLSPYFSDTKVRAVRSGTWRVRLHGIDVRDGRFDGWIERDDFQGNEGSMYFALPSVFSAASNVDRSSVSSLACGQNVVAVANLDARLENVHVSSSQGPTRDGRSKPEVGAPGTDILAASGFSTSDKRWIRMTGTSMASPHVAGIVGLMLSREPNLTAAQILGILRRTAQPLPGHDYQWRDDAGYGAVNAALAIAEAPTMLARKEVP